MKDMEQRELKLKAWDKLNSRWIKVQGFKVQSGELLPWEYRQSEFSTVEWVYVDNFEIVQFTGLKDKNGKEIYDGDIIRRSSGYVFEVILREYRLGEINQAKAFGHDWHESDEVIGNVFETPELISKQLT